jgi:hypothetical protein
MKRAGLIGILLIGTMAAARAASPDFIVGQTTIADLTKQLGAPIARKNCPKMIGAIWVRTAFRGAAANGQPVQMIETVYTAGFRTDGVLMYVIPMGKGRLSTPSEWILGPCPK